MISRHLSNSFTSVTLAVVSLFNPAPNSSLAKQENDKPQTVKSFSDGMTESVLKNDQSQRLTHLSKGLLSWQNLTEQERQDPAFFIVGLKSQEWIDALNSINKDLVENKEIQEAIIEQLSKHGDRFYNTLILQATKEILSNSESFKRLLLSDGMIVEVNVWNSLLDPKDQYFSEVKELLTEDLSSLIDYYNETQPENVVKVISIIPSALKHDSRFNDAVRVLLEQSDITEVQVLICLNGFDIPKDLFFRKVTSLLNSDNKSVARQAGSLFIDNLTAVDLGSSDIRKSLASFLGNDSQFPIIWKMELLNSDQFIAFFTEVVKENPAVARKINIGVYKQSPQLQESILSVLSEERILSTLVDYTSSLSTFERVPPIALEIAEVRNGMRKTCNYHIQSVMGATLPDSVLKCLPQFVQYVPEILRVPRQLGALKYQDFKAPDYVTINPNSFSNLLNSEAAPPSDAINAYANAINAMRLLHIDGLNRFDNAREILKNRYNVAEPNIQKQLEELMPPGYFHEVKQDSRPYCIFIMAHPGADHNEIFSRMNSGMRDTDFVDSLTTSYRVLYFEVLNEAVLANELSKLANVYNLKAELCFIAGHGSSDAVALGRYGQNLVTDSNAVFKDLANIMNPNGSVALISCSTGASNGDSKSIHSALVEALPNCTVIAPDADTMLPYLILDKNGMFKTLEYVGANGVVYNPITKETNIEKGHNEWIAVYGRWLEYNPLMTLACSYVALSVLRMGALFGLRRAKSVLTAFEQATEEGRQKLLFPSFWDKGWFRRFARALVTDRGKKVKSEE